MQADIDGDGNVNYEEFVAMLFSGVSWLVISFRESENNFEFPCLFLCFSLEGVGSSSFSENQKIFSAVRSFKELRRCCSDGAEFWKEKKRLRGCCTFSTIPHIFNCITASYFELECNCIS